MSSSEDRPGGAATIVGASVSLVVFSIVLVGWKAGIESLVSPDHRWIGVLVGILMATLAVSLAYEIARIWLRRTAKTTDAQREIWPVYLAILFLISAMGTANTAFLYVSGPGVMRETISAVQKQIESLELEASEKLIDTKFVVKQGRLQALLDTLDQEVRTNPNQARSKTGVCGVGAEARITIQKIQQLLPEFRLPSGTNGALHCRNDEAKLTALMDSIKSGINSAFSKQESFLSEQGPEKAEVLKSLGSDLKETRAQLAEILNGLNGGGPLSLSSERSVLERCRAGLGRASEKYEKYHVKIGQIARTELKSPPRLNVDAVNHLGSFAHLLPLLMTRLGDGSTWVIIFFALGIDIALARVLMPVAAVYSKFRSGQVRSGSSIMSPQYLWVDASQ